MDVVEAIFFGYIGLFVSLYLIAGVVVAVKGTPKQIDSFIRGDEL